MPDIGVVVGELLGLLMDRIGDLGAAIADIHAIEAGERVEGFAPLAVDDRDSLAAGDDAVRRLAGRMLAHMGRGMEEMGAVDRPKLGGVIAFHLFLYPLKDWKITSLKSRTKCAS